MAWCASETSPGIGTWPPPISPASEMVGWGTRHGRVVTNAVRSPGEDRDTMDARGLNGLGEGHRRQDGSRPARSHGLACAGTLGGMSLTGVCDGETRHGGPSHGHPPSRMMRFSRLSATLDSPASLAML